MLDLNYQDRATKVTEEEMKEFVLHGTIEIVTASAAHGNVDIVALIPKVAAALRGLVTKPEVEAVTPTPAVPIKKSITPDYIVCLDDGKKVKVLKRHLAKLGMTPDQYRQRWDLPADYPMVAPGYAKQRSELAKSFGLGLARKPE